MSIIKRIERLLEGERRKHRSSKPKSRARKKKKKTPPRKQNGEFRKRR